MASHPAPTPTARKSPAKPPSARNRCDSHRTYYNFTGTVRLEPHTLRLRPKEGHDLRIESSSLDISPAATLRWHSDVEGRSPSRLPTAIGFNLRYVGLGWVLSLAAEESDLSGRLLYQQQQPVGDISHSPEPTPPAAKTDQQPSTPQESGGTSPHPTVKSPHDHAACRFLSRLCPHHGSDCVSARAPARAA
ncbi:MAG: transglutaminase N-terminal domain-containing protein [Thiobacillus sp.]